MHINKPQSQTDQKGGYLPMGSVGFSHSTIQRHQEFINTDLIEIPSEYTDDESNAENGDGTHTTDL